MYEQSQICKVMFICAIFVITVLSVVLAVDNKTLPFLVVQLIIAVFLMFFVAENKSYLRVYVSVRIIRLCAL